MSDYDPFYIPKKIFFLVGQKAIVLNNQNKILVLKRSEKSGAGDKWSLPGGGLEEKEDPYEAIKREVNEETQLNITNIQPYNLRTYTTKENDLVLIVGYQCRATNKKVILNWEHDDYKWLTREEAIQLQLTEDGKYFIEHFDKNKKF